MHIRRVCGGSAGVRGGSTPDAGRFRSCAARVGDRRRIGGDLAARRSAHTRSRGAGLSRRPVRPRRVRRLGRALVRGSRPARLQPAVSRRSPRCSACACSRPCSVLVSVALFERLVLGVYGRVRALGRRLVRGCRRRRHLDRAADVRARRHLRPGRRARAGPRASPLGGAAGGAVRGRQPRGGRAARARGAHACARATLAPRAAGAGGARGRGRRAARAAVPRRRLRAVPEYFVRGDRARDAAVPLGAAPGAAPAADRRGPLPAGLRAGAGGAHAHGQQHRALRGAAGRAAAAVCPSCESGPAGRSNAAGVWRRRRWSRWAASPSSRCGAPCARR